jgi:hypothetical protein
MSINLKNDYIHREGYYHTGDVVELTTDTECNLKLIDDSNYARYRRFESYNCYKLEVTTSPARLTVPSTDNWHIVVDVDMGHKANINYTLNVIPRRA